MSSETVGGVLGAIVGSAILVVAIAYGPIGQMGKPQKQFKRLEPPKEPRLCRAGRQGAGGAEKCRSSRGGRNRPLAKRPDRSYLASNGDVDAS